MITNHEPYFLSFLLVRPTLIENPRVRILNKLNDTTKRQFPVRTVLLLTCKGQIGSDPNNVRIYTNFRRITSDNVHVFSLVCYQLYMLWFQTIGWCVKKENEQIFTKLDQTPLHSNASFNGSQYIRSSTITYILTSQDTFTKFLCESGDTGVCGTGTAIQYVNISITGKLSQYMYILYLLIIFRHTNRIIGKLLCRLFLVLSTFVDFL